MPRSLVIQPVKLKNLHMIWAPWPLYIIKIYNSKLSEIKQSDARRSTTNQQRGHSKRRQIAIMLLVASFTIILCTLPFSVYTTLELNITFLQTNANERSIKHLISSLSFPLIQ
jgi:hypothetical protein